MNKNITLGIILVIILVVGIWNPNLLETMVNPQTFKPKPKPPTPTEQVEVINKILEEAIPFWEKMNSSVIGIQKLKKNIILFLEQIILLTITPRIIHGKPLPSLDDIIDNLKSDEVLKTITLYNGLRAMPFR